METPTMERIRMHFVRSSLAGLVALLPLVGFVLTVVYFENQVAGVWLKQQGFYFFGLGLVLVLLLTYLVGLTVSTFLGNWLWKRLDRLLDQLPILGNLYQTFKQILGYGEGPKGLFQRVVLVRSDAGDRREIGLVTQEPSPASGQLLVVFVPTAPTPTGGRLIFVAPDRVEPSTMTVSQALQFVVSLGALDSKTTG
jgi:uncharacterized membrane protein